MWGFVTELGTFRHKYTVSWGANSTPFLALARWSQLVGRPMLGEGNHQPQLACLNQRRGSQHLQTALGIDPDRRSSCSMTRCLVPGWEGALPRLCGRQTDPTSWRSHALDRAVGASIDRERHCEYRMMARGSD